MVLKKKKTVTRKKEVKKSVSNYLAGAQPVDEAEEYWTALFYGRSGTGKTTVASTFPKDLLLLDFRDKGTQSIKNVVGVKVIRMDEWDFVEGIYWELKKGGHDYETVVLDTIDGMQNLAINKIKEENRKEETENLSQREWGAVSGLMSQWLFFYRDLPMNVVFLSHERTKNAREEEIEGADADQLEPEVGPAVIPSVARSINAAVNIIGHTFIRQTVKREGGKSIRKTNFMLRLGPHPFYITKIRKPKEFLVPQAISNASFDKIIKITKGEQ